MKRFAITSLTITAALLTFIMSLMLLIPLAIMALISNRIVLSSAPRQTRDSGSEHIIEGEYQDVTNTRQSQLK